MILQKKVTSCIPNQGYSTLGFASATVLIVTIWIDSNHDLSSTQQIHCQDGVLLEPESSG